LGKAELNNWTYNTFQSNATTAKEVASKVTEILKKHGRVQDRPDHPDDQ
jgi:hypothetical protein